MAGCYQKILVVGSLVWMAVTNGFTYGHMTGLARALQARDGGILLGEAEISLISAFVTFSYAIGIVLLAVIGDRVGRRWCFILSSIPTVTNWIILYYAKEMVAFMMSRLLAGITIGATTTLNLVVTAEYTSPKTRAFFLSVVSMVSPALGTGLGHILGVVVHWKTLIFVAMFLSAVQVVLPYFWVESPQWLASKGRFEDAERAFRKLHGDDTRAEYELRQLMKVESRKQKAASETNAGHSVRKLLLALKRRYFWDLMLMSAIIYLYYAVAGKLIFSSLATVMLEEMTGTSDVLLFTLLVDAFILVGTCCSCVLVKTFSIRVLLFTSGLMANGVLIVLSACLYLKNTEVYFQWVNVTLLAIYFVIINAGPYPVMEILLGEIFPLELKLYCFLISSPVLIATIFASIMLLPSMVGVMGYHGLFLLNAAITFLCLWYLWTRLPETKGKTLQEIEMYFKTNNFDVDEMLGDEQMRAFI